MTALAKKNKIVKNINRQLFIGIAMKNTFNCGANRLIISNPNSARKIQSISAPENEKLPL
jgi:hypothetical protein